MDKQVVIHRLCKLGTKVGVEVFQSKDGHDCFCGDNRLSNTVLNTFTFSKKVIEFIEQVVNKDIRESGG